VTDAATGAGIQFATITFAECPRGLGSCGGFRPSDGTGDSGNYQLLLQPGTYLLQFSKNVLTAGGYAVQYWRGARTRAEATLLTVGESDLTGIDVAMERGHFLRGTASYRTTGGIRFAQNLTVGLYSGSPTPCCVQLAVFEQNGPFRFFVPNGRYRIFFRPRDAQPIAASTPTEQPALAGRWWPNAADFASSAEIEVKGADVDGLDALLDAVATYRLAGSIASAVAYIPLVEKVVVYDANAACCVIVAEVSGDHSYSVNLPAGKYRLEFRQNRISWFATQWWDGALSAASARDVVLKANLENVSVSVDRYQYSISGRVTSSATGDGIRGVTVRISPDFGLGSPGTTVTDSSGNYSVALQSGTYVRFEFIPAGNSGFGPQAYEGEVNLEAPNFRVSGFNVTLPPTP
jgi:hypothetical protein